MPNGWVAPGCVLPTGGLGHHHEAARPVARDGSAASVPMNGSTASSMARTYGTDVLAVFRRGELGSRAQASAAARPSGSATLTHKAEWSCRPITRGIFSTNSMHSPRWLFVPKVSPSSLKLSRRPTAVYHR